MKHTVVIPLYNKEAFIYDTIRSLAFQEKKASQIIIVDDFSTDQSMFLLKDALAFFAPQFLLTEVEIIELKENKGPGHARNIGMGLATGDLISFLDADDCYTSSCLKEVGLIMEQENIDVLVLGLLLIPSNYYLPNISSFKKEMTSLSNELFLIPNILHTISSPDFIMGVGSNVVIRKKHLENIRYETSVSLNEGIDFWYRVLKSLKDKPKVALLNKVCIEVREVEGSLSRIKYSNWKELKIPVTIERYHKSTDKYDQQLMGMLSQRWLEHAMERLPSWRQKMLFLVNHSKSLIRNWYYFKKDRIKIKTMSPDIPKTEKSELQDYFELAKKNPLYIDFYKEHDCAEKAPVLSKKELMPILKNNFKLHEEKTGVYLVRSGGSTQNPLVFPVDIQENQNQRLAMASELTKNNFFTSKTIALNIFGYSDMYRTAAIMDDILEKCQSTTLALSAHASYKDMEQAAAYFKPDFIMGTPSKLLCFAQFLQENNQKLQIKNLLYAGEFLRPEVQKNLEKVFGLQQIYSMYGSAETGIWAWSDFTQNPSLFSVIEGIIIEIINPDNDGYGTIAVTNSFRKRFPVFRYAIGDLGRWVNLDGKAFLELKSRETKSFILSEQHYDLDEFNFLTSSATAFQIQLSSKNFKEVVKMLLVQNVPQNQKADFIADKSQALKKRLDYNERFMEVEVLLVAASDLYTDPNTTKTPQLLDLR